MGLRRRWLTSLGLSSMLLSLAGTGTAMGGCSGGDDSAGSPGTDDGGSSGDAAVNGESSVSSDGSPIANDASQPAPDASTALAMNTISGWMNACLPYGNPTGTFRTTVLQAIVDACDAFGPPETNAGWKKEYCWAHMMGAILSESSYQVDAIAEPGQDPTVGLTQIRFSSVVCGFYTGGPRAALEAMGCAFPADFAAHASEPCYSSTYWQTTGGDAAHTAFMEIPQCNIGLGAWAYYLFATGGGDATTTQYQEQICAGQGQSADLATGLCAYLEGPNKSFAHIASLNDVPPGATSYVTKIKGLMDCALGTVSGTHPLFVSLAPNPPQYCQ